MSCSRLTNTWHPIATLFKAVYHKEAEAIYIIGWRAHGPGTRPCYRHSDIAGDELK